jgi:xylose isomerase
MSIIMRAFNKSSKSTKEKTKLEYFEKLWTDFDCFFQAVVKDDQKVLKEALKKTKKLINAPEI